MWSLAVSRRVFKSAPFLKKTYVKSAHKKLKYPQNICLYFNPHASSGSVTYVVTPMIEWLYAFNLVSHT